MKRYFLIIDATAEEVERATGLHGHDTPLGALVEKPKRFSLEHELEKFDRILHPTRCTCGKFAVIHRPGCPVGNAIT